MHAETEPAIDFPDLIRESTLGFPTTALCAIAGGLVIPWSRVAGVLLFVPCVLSGANSLITTTRNATIRARWARSFASTLNHRQVKALIQKDPQRYTLHVRYYGSFDVVRLRPAAVLEDHQSGTLHAVYPPCARVVRTCEAIGTAIVS